MGNSIRARCLAALIACVAAGCAPDTGDSAIPVRSEPWAVLLVRFRDHLEESPVPRSQYDRLFTAAGAGTYNLPAWVLDNSHGQIDISGSQVFGPLVIQADSTTYIPNTWGYDNRPDMVRLAKEAAVSAGVPLANFKGVIVCFDNIAVAVSSGSVSMPGPGPAPGVFSDYRFVQNNGTEAFAHEIMHAYGPLDAGRDGTTELYTDPWDIMSALRSYEALDPDYVNRGPGLNAASMRAIGWLDSSRAWRRTGGFSEVVQLTSLHRRDLAGHLAAEIGPVENGVPRYVIELRIKERWDSGFPRSAVFVHRYSGERSYLMGGQTSSGAQVFDLVPGAYFQDGPHLRVDVLAIDEVTKTASVRLRSDERANNVAAVNLGLDIHLLSLGTNGTVLHRMYRDSTSTWEPATTIPTPSFPPSAQLTVVATSASSLAAFVVGGDGQVYSSEYANSQWSPWGRVALRSTPAQPGSYVGAASRSPGFLDVFVVGSDGAVSTAWKVPGGAWNGWYSVLAGSGPRFPTGTPVTATSRYGGLDLFAFDPGAQRMVVAYYGDEIGWHGWYPVGGPVDATSLPRISVVGRRPSAIDVFLVDTSSKVRQLSYTDESGVWSNEWSEVPGGAFPPGTPITALSRYPDSLDLFAVASDGNVYSAWAAAKTSPHLSSDWHGWSQIGSAAAAQAATAVPAVTRNIGWIDTFVIGTSGYPRTASYADQIGRWNGWVDF